MFDFVCMLLAFVINYFATIENKKAAYIMMGWFIVSNFGYFPILEDLRKEYNSLIYIIYILINVLIGISLKKINAHTCIILVMAVSVLLNSFVIPYFAYDFIGETIYNAYKYPAMLISFLVLIYMLLLTKIGDFFGLRHNNKNIFCRIFWVRYADNKWFFMGRNS